MKKINLIYIIVILLLPGSKCFSQEQKLHIYGFFDFETEVSNKDAAGKNWTFDQHHLNIITTYILDDRFSVATEIEWEHGPAYSPSSSTGNIYLAKAFLEYKYSDVFLVRIGKFLSPFGIYNERHDATPTFLSSFLPQSVYGNQEQSFGGKGRLFAKQSTGMQILGNLFFRDWGMKYQVYLTNGRGPNNAEKDNNSNKGLGWRLVISPPLAELRIGTSFYTDKNGTANNTQQTTLGFDIEYDISAAHIEAEYFFPKLEKVDNAGNPNGNFRDVNGYYILGAYTFFDVLTPFARYEFFDSDLDIGNNGENMTTVGLNYAVTSSVFLKAEVEFFWFQNPSLKKYELFVASVAVAF
ncbi:MAG: hypothetical protein ABIJ97_01790 [Bacteroidota bacterium]